MVYIVLVVPGEVMYKFYHGLRYLPFPVFGAALDLIIIIVTTKVTTEDTRIHPTHIPATVPSLRPVEP